ncbi:hypothetical protein LMIY3S_01738 [Labrys miyagiensis]
MAEPLKKDEALAAAVREAFQRHMEAARQAAEALKEKQAVAPSASLPPLSAPRDPRLAVPAPANDGRASPEAAKLAAAPAKPPAEPVSLSRLVAIATPPKVSEPAPAEVLAPASSAPVPAVEPAPPVEAVVAEDAAVLEVVDAPKAEAPIADAAVEPVQDDKTRPNSDNIVVDFGEALFIEIAPALDKQPLGDLPKMPRAASLETSGRETLSQSASDDLEFRQPPLRERPRMSTASVSSGPPQDLDLLVRKPGNDAASIAEAKPSREDKVGDLPARATSGKTSTRFGVAAPARPAPVNGNKRARFAAPGKFRIPGALVASLALAVGIAGVGAYFWANPEKLQAIGALVAPPSPQEARVAVAPPQSKPAQDAKIDTPLPTNQSAPTSSPSATSIASVPPPAPPAATRSVDTVAITLDEVDEAVQSARELTSIGDIDGARQALDSYKNGSDPRALFALAETYDPAIVKDPAKANPAQAKAFYEAAAKAGSRDNTADRIARLALAHTN